MGHEYLHEYFRERQEYSRNKLKSKLKDDGSLLAGILRKLAEHGIATIRVKGNDASVLSLSGPNWDKITWEFNFVGVIVTDYCVLHCYPKYIASNEAPKEELRQVLDVIGEYKRSEEYSMEGMDDSGEDDSSNILPLMHWLMTDYYENGVYCNTRDIIEVNGDGEILWDKTVNETVALIHRGRPYYMDLLTRRRVNDEYDYCRRLHECILTSISEELKDAELLNLLGLSEVELTDAKLEDFGETGYVLYRIERELNVQFNTRKQLLLRNMYDYIAQRDTLHDEDGLTFLGVTDFEYVWEAVCGRIMEDQRNTAVGRLPFLRDGETGLHEDYVSHEGEDLKGLLRKPFWSKLKREAGNPLRPDLITIKKIDGIWHFIIFDAKYYDAAALVEGGEPKGIPGVSDVTKQYIYQLAYQKFIRVHGFKPGNCFLMPTEKDEIGFGGNVHMKMMQRLFGQMLGREEIDGMKGLPDIKVRFLPARMAYEYYLNWEPFPVAKLELDADK